MRKQWHITVLMKIHINDREVDLASSSTIVGDEAERDRFHPQEPRALFSE